jgi:hypothetical protein
MSAEPYRDPHVVFTILDEVGREICGVSVVGDDIMDANSVIRSFALEYGLVERHLRYPSYGIIDFARPA